MEISKAAIGFLAAACLTVGAGGAYLMKHSEPGPETRQTSAVDLGRLARPDDRRARVLMHPVGLADLDVLEACCRERGLELAAG